MATATCKKCKAQVRFIQNINTGNMVILDLKPNPERGNIIISGQGFYCSVVPKAELAVARERGDTLFVDHHATCPNAGDFKRRKGAPAKRMPPRASGG